MIRRLVTWGALFPVAAVAVACGGSGRITASTKCSDYLNKNETERHDAAIRISSQLHTTDPGNPMWGLSLDAACGASRSSTIGEIFRGQTSSAAAPTTEAAPPAAVTGASIAGATPCPKADGSSPRTTTFAKAPPMCIDPAKTYTAIMKTSQGTISIALNPNQAPRTVNNYVVLARYHFYDGLIFHRVVPGFVIQGGDPKGDGTGGPGYTFEDELPKAGQYKLSSLVMANSGPNTNGSQFFIITGDQGVQLQPNYTLFGQVTSGADVTQKIDALGVQGSPTGTPSERITIQSVTVNES